MKQISWMFCCIGVVGCILLWHPLVWASSTQPCNLLAEQQRHREAATCFMRIVKQTQHGSQLNRLAKKYKAFLLEKAAFYYQRAASTVQEKKRQDYWHEKAAEALHQITTENLCLKRYRCRQITGKRSELLQLIRYARLALLPQGKTFHVMLSGFHYKQEMVVAKATLLELRAGNYTVVYRHQQEAPQTRSITLQPQETQSITLLLRPSLGLTQPPSRPPVRSTTGAWVLVGTGIAVTLAGTVFVIAGYAIASNASKTAQEQILMRSDQALQKTYGNSSIPNIVQSGQINLLLWNTDSQKVKTQGTLGDILTVTGWTTLGVGGAVLLGGIIWKSTSAVPSVPPSVPADGKR